MKLLINFVAEGFTEDQPVPVPEKSVFVNKAGECFFVQSDHKESPEAQTTRGHGIEYLHAVMGRGRYRIGGPFQ